MSDWQPIETAPKTTDVLIFARGRIVIAHQNVYGDWSEPNGDELSIYLETAHECDATHWMPLPKPPAPTT